MLMPYLSLPSFLRVEEGSLSRTLVFNSGQSNAQEEYAMKRDREVMMTAYDMFITGLN